MQAKNTEQVHQEPDATAVLSTIGQARIAPYRTYFNCKNDIEALGVYLWGQALAGAFQPPLGMYEVVLRNAVHRAASRFTSKGVSESFAWYDYTENWALPIRGKTRDKVTEVLYNTFSAPPMRLAPQPTPDAVVASLSFGFWPGFLEGLSMRERPRILTDTFAYHPKSKLKHWSDAQNVVELISILKKLQSMRNAVAHLEPIWKPHRLKGTEKHWSHSVVSLRESLDQMIEVMAWCCPASAAAVHHSYARRIFRNICSTDAVKAFMDDPFQAGRMQPFVENVQAQQLAKTAVPVVAPTI